MLSSSKWGTFWKGHLVTDNPRAQPRKPSLTWNSNKKGVKSAVQREGKEGSPALPVPGGCNSTLRIESVSDTGPASWRAAGQLEAEHTRTGSEVPVGWGAVQSGWGAVQTQQNLLQSQQGRQNCPSEHGEERGQTVARNNRLTGIPKLNSYTSYEKSVHWPLFCLYSGVGKTANAAFLI